MTSNHAIIQEITLSQTTASVTIPIPTGYTDLRIIMSLRSTNTESAGVIYFNSDTTNTNYNVRRMLGEGSGQPSSAASNYPYMYYISPSTDTTYSFSNHEVYVPNYLSSDIKTALIETARENNAAYGINGLVTAKWSGTAAINSLTIKPYNEGGASFAAGSSFTVYGITKTGTTTASMPKATGGDVIKNDGTYWYHAFLSSGIFTPKDLVSADIIVFGGGGGGGYGYAAGGGAGALRYFQSQPLTKSSYAVAIGAGGIGGGTAEYSRGFKGNNSQFGSLSDAEGGGSGGSQPSPAGQNGGCGGGAYNNTAGTGSVGGSGSGSGFGGGGGMGGNASGDLAGPGVSTYNSWSTVTGIGKLVSGTYWLCAGGNGESNSDTSLGRTPGWSGAQQNTGCGGGGNGGYPNSGGSGAVIIRYLMV